MNRIVDALARDDRADPDFARHAAFRYRGRDAAFEPVRHVDPTTIEDMVGVERAWTAFDRNTRQLLRRLPCNHVLLWGARGTGKSSLVKAALNRYTADGLRVVEVRRDGLLDLSSIVDRLADAPQSFYILLDDLAFEENDPLAREMKALLEGGMQATPDNARVVATANRRHLMPRRASDNVRAEDDELHLRDAAEEKASLADRFGLRLGFPAPTEAFFLNVVRAIARKAGVAGHLDSIVPEAVVWGRARGLSGRAARQFMDDWTGRYRLECERAGDAEGPA